MRTSRPADDAAPASASGSSPADDALAHLNGYLVLRPRKELLAQHVPVLLLPLLGEEVDDGVMARKELIPVAPDAIRCVRLSGNGLVYPPFTSSFSWRHIHEGQIAVTARPRQDYSYSTHQSNRDGGPTLLLLLGSGWVSGFSGDLWDFQGSHTTYILLVRSE